MTDRWLYGWALGYAAVGAASPLVPLYALGGGAPTATPTESLWRPAGSLPLGRLPTPMSDPRDPLAAFDDALLETVAAEVDCSPEALRGLVSRHQTLVRETPGVDDLLYEWRKYYPYDPLVARTERAFHVVLREQVWAEFTDRLGLSPAERRALLAVHDRQARADADDESVYDGGAPMVLTRP